MVSNANSSRTYATPMKVVHDGEIDVHYRQFYIEPKESEGITPEKAFAGMVNGMCGTLVTNNIYLITGLHTGHVLLKVITYSEVPDLNYDDWEEVVLSIFSCTGDKLVLRKWGGEDVASLQLSQGSYQVIYCANKMAEGSEIDPIVDEEAIDSYFLGFWPSMVPVDRVIKQTADIARYWNEEAFSR